MAINKTEAKKFAKSWEGKGYERGETHHFWLDLLSKVLGYDHTDTVEFEHHLSTGGFIDVWIRQSDVMIEQKSFGVDLDKPEPRQGEMKTPLQQVIDYAASLPQTEQPKYFITCNFSTFRVYDRSQYGDKELKDHPFEFSLQELSEHPEYLSFITDPRNSRLRKEQEVSEQAGRLVGQLYDMLREQYIDPDSEDSRHSLNVLCVRLVFCLFCEDAGLFGEPDAFCNYLQKVEPENIRMNLQRLFEALDTPWENRDPYEMSIKVFPYVNGGLFRDKVVIPNFTQDIKDFLLDVVARPTDWSKISPTIFGGIFESTLNPETRRKGGMHYTSPENIHKVIDPLFLDDLKAEFESIRTDEQLSVIKRKNAYKRFHKKLCSLVFFDPACGSGNFLTETYICLRQLEYAVLKEYKSKQMSLFDSSVEGEIDFRIKLDQFYGIEINDFAVSVAETALWISRLKANKEYLLLLDLDEKDFPLTDRANIICENALRFNWGNLVESSTVSYIMGNPPFVGSSMMSETQKKEILSIFIDNGGKTYKTAGKNDYVSAWFFKAADYIKDTDIKVAFVATNSITQGEQVNSIWKAILERFGIAINFAYRTFVWDSTANDKAHVHCVIIGFSNTDQPIKKIFDKNNEYSVSHINPYLLDMDDILVEPRNNALCQIPDIVNGFKAADNGYLILDENEYHEFIQEEPAATKWIRPYSMGVEFIRNIPRYCLWLADITDSELDSLPLIKARVEQCKEWRTNAKQTGDAYKLRDIPHLFRPCKQFKDAPYIAVPLVSSERRDYVPMGYIYNGMIPGNNLFSIFDAGLYHYGVLTSNIHMGWMRTVGGKLKSDYRYSKDLVYNNFPWPTPTDEQKTIIEKTSQGILDARANHPDKSLADLYDPDKMPDDLKAAHEANDKAVMDAYGFSHDMTEPEIVAELMKMYQKLIE